MHRGTRVALGGIVLLAFLLSGCTAGNSGQGTAPTEAESVPLSLYREGIRLAYDSGTMFQGHTGSRIGSDTRLKTDKLGVAGFTFAGGSILRIGSDSSIEVVRSTPKGDEVRVGVGQSWHEAAADYLVRSGAGTMAADDAIFSLTCSTATSCKLVVLAGEVTATPTDGTAVTVGAFQQFAVAPGEASPPTIFPLDAQFNDEWISLNLAFDDGDTRPPVDTSSESVLAAASLAGTWAIDTVVTSSDDPSNPPGTRTHRDWEFGAATCEKSCRMTLTRTFGPIGQPANETTIEELSYTAAGLRAHREYTNACTSADGQVLAQDYFFQTSDYDLRVAEVEMVGSVPTALRFDGTATSTTAFAGKPFVDGCYLNSVNPVVQSVSGTLVTPVTRAALAEPLPLLTAPTGTQPSGLAGAPDAPSVLSSLTTAQELDLSAVKVATTAALAIILLLIVGYPAQLLNSTISNNYDRILSRLDPLTRRLKRRRGERWHPSRKLVITVGVTVAAVISAFVDPGFGFNLASLRLLVSVALSFLVDSLCAWLLISAIVRRANASARPLVDFRTGSLVIVVAAVLFSRLTGFEPGMVFGAVVGLTLGITLTKAGTARLTGIGLGYAAAVSTFAWLAFSILTPAFGTNPGFFGVFVLETLSSAAVAGFASLPIVLLPMAVLDGGKLFAWSRIGWAVAYVFGLFVFLLILLPLPSSWGTVATPFAAWLGLYIGFAVFAIGFWSYFRIVRKRPSARVPVNPASVDAVRTP